MAVRTFDRTVLVRYASIVAGRLHAVVRAKRLVTTRLVLPRVVVEIAEGGRQAVAAMLQRGAAERPQRILQPLGQCHKAFAAEHDMGVLPLLALGPGCPQRRIRLISIEPPATTLEK